MVVPWSEISARKWAKVGQPIAAHEFCKRLTNKPMEGWNMAGFKGFESGNCRKDRRRIWNG